MVAVVQVEETMIETAVTMIEAENLEAEVLGIEVDEVPALVQGGIGVHSVKVVLSGEPRLSNGTGKGNKMEEQMARMKMVIIDAAF